MGSHFLSLLLHGFVRRTEASKLLLGLSTQQTSRRVRERTAQRRQTDKQAASSSSADNGVEHAGTKWMAHSWNGSMILRVHWVEEVVEDLGKTRNTSIQEVLGS
jgi:hypothetical protein